MNDYETFAVDIRPAGGGGTIVHARWGEDAAAEAPFACSVSSEELRALVACVGYPPKDDVRPSDRATTFGRKLYEAVFSGEVGKAHSAARAQAAGRDHGLRLMLDLAACPELMDWPWEFLRDDESFLAVSGTSPVARYLEVSRDRPPLEVSGRVRIVGMVSSPAGFPQLDIAAERATIETAIEPLRAQGKAELVWVPEPTLGSLYETVDAARDDEGFHIFHYVGHGAFHEDTGEGALLFDASDRGAAEVPGSQLATVLREHASLRLAVLNTCNGGRTGVVNRFSGVAAALVKVGIPAVVAMQFPISDRAGVAFARRFYDGLLAHNEGVDVALAGSRMSLFANDPEGLEWATPVVFLRNRSGRIFDFGPQRSRVVSEQMPADQAAVAPAAPGPAAGEQPPEVPSGRGFRSAEGAFAAMEQYIASAPDSPTSPAPGDQVPQPPHEPSPASYPPPTFNWGDILSVLPGNWVVDMASPAYGLTTMQLTLVSIPTGQAFEGRALGVPMMVTGGWSVVGNQLFLSGIRIAGAAPFAQQWPYEVAITIQSLSPNLVQGATTAGENITFRRQ